VEVALRLGRGPHLLLEVEVHLPSPYLAQLVVVLV
jgi:hypothetical protein